MAKRFATDISSDSDAQSAYHSGERAVQEAAGVRDRAEQLGRMFRPFMVDAQRGFFEHLPFVLVGSLDAAGQPWASMLIGEPGFIRAHDPETLLIFAQPAGDDPLSGAIREGAALGLLGIEPQHRRRNRINGHVQEVGSRGFSVHVDQAYGNCPKYITPRRPTRDGAELQPAAAMLEAPQLSDGALACISAADTCFIASASGRLAPEGDRREGVDVSHRGGAPGFVQVTQEPSGTRLWMPDYPGNNAFNTLGNIASYPRAGLLFPNFETGDILQLTCDAELHFDGAELERFSGAQRLASFRVQSGRYVPHFMPFRWQR
jgi:predicted pyridoxine 5'-phosphate oxidase superfamily flavin-nucleotide-binding protein